MRRRYNPNQLELFPELVTQDAPSNSKRSHENLQRGGERLRPLRSNRGLRIYMHSIGAGVWVPRVRGTPDATDDIEREMSLSVR